MSADVGTMEYSHVQMYVENLKEIEVYKALEEQCNAFVQKWRTVDQDLQKGKEIWKEMAGEPAPYVPAGQDVVDQMITGLGWRIVAHNESPSSRSLLLTSADPQGAKFVITAPVDDAEPSAKKRKTVADDHDHFNSDHINRFLKTHKGRQGIAVLAFKTGAGVVAGAAKRYSELHPKLILTPPKTYQENGVDFTLFEVFAYYLPDSREADVGTVLRFVECSEDSIVLPGLSGVDAEYTLQTPAYSDHWVSNVVDRKQFLSTLKDTLGFIPKVDFNAGVVAAGEAIIESTVLGNTPSVAKGMTTDQVLLDQTQVFLPTNNALSEVGHVHMFVAEIGQGIQHIASRVKDLVPFIERTNTLREMTGRGFSFLNIPRSYYGRMTQAQLAAATDGKEGVLGAEAAEAVFEALTKAGVCDDGGIVQLCVTDESIATALPEAHTAFLADVCAVVKGSRFCNLKRLLGDHLSEESFLSIVKNKVLVDIQGEDILYQIFTSNILQKKSGEEAPFLEFIQRVCSQKKDAQGNAKPIRPGCGGFGIRNFLTLFLSIEVSKAMHQVTEARTKGDTKAQELASAMVEAFTQQLDESNPILTRISDAMTGEGIARDAAAAADSPEVKAQHEADVAKFEAVKNEGQAALQTCSDKYKAIMAALRNA